MIYENADEFYGLPVIEFKDADSWQGTDVAYSVSVDWDTPIDEVGKRLQRIASQPQADQLQAIVIGAWFGDDSQASSDVVIETLAGCKDQFKDVQAIFLGDITSEQNEISWIEQSDVTPLLNAYPKLELLRIRGGHNLSFSKTEHQQLKTLIIETGGLPRSVLREIFRCEFPNLEHLELWLGTEDYGGDAGPEDLQPLLTGKLFPKLNYLGLRNRDGIDEIVPVLPNAPLLSRIKVLDLSLGNLTDVGARSLLALNKNSSLEKLDISHHYVTSNVVGQLRSQLPFDVVADDAQDDEDEWRSIYVSE